MLIYAVGPIYIVFHVAVDVWDEHIYTWGQKTFAIKSITSILTKYHTLTNKVK